MPHRKLTCVGADPAWKKVARPVWPLFFGFDAATSGPDFAGAVFAVTAEFAADLDVAANDWWRNSGKPGYGDGGKGGCDASCDPGQTFRTAGHA